MISREVKRRLKTMLIKTLEGKLPVRDEHSHYWMWAVPTSGTDTFLNIKVKDEHGNIETYFEVSVKERL